MPKAKTTEKALEETRERIRAAKAEREAATKAPRPREEVARDVRASVEALASRALPNVAELVAPRGASNLRLFDTAYQALAQTGGDGAGRAAAQMTHDLAGQAAGLLAAIQPEALEGWIMARVDAELARLPAPLGAEERRARLAERDAELRRLEVEEERIAEGLEAEGREVLRRSDASPEVVLGLAEEATA